MEPKVHYRVHKRLWEALSWATRIQSPFPHGYLTHFTTIVQSATGSTNYDFVCSSLPHTRNTTITKVYTQIAEHTATRVHPILSPQPTFKHKCILPENIVYEN